MNFRFSYALLTVALICPAILAAVSGTVLDNTGTPLPEVYVTVSSKNLSAVTDENGVFSVELAPGRYTIEIFDIPYDVLFQAEKPNIITLKTASVTVIGRMTSSGTVNTVEDIQKSTGSGLSDMLSKEADIHTAGIGGALSTVSIGGFAKHRIQTTVNGFRVSADRRAGSDLGTLIPSMADRAGVYRGSSGSALGSEAIGGALDIGLAAPDGGKHFSFLSEFSENNNRGLAFLSAALPSFVVSAAFEDAGRYEDGEDNKQEGFYSRTNLHTAWKPAIGRFTLIDAFYSEGNDIGKPSTSSSPTVYPDDILAFTGIRSFGKRTDFQAAVIYQELFTYKAGESSEVTSWNFHGTGMYHFRGWRAGLDIYTRQNVDSTVFLDSGISKPIEDGKRWEISPIVSYRKPFGRFFTFSGNARYQYFRASNKGMSFDDDIANGSAELSASSKAGVFALQLYTTYRFPSLDELLYSGLTARGYIEANPDLSPEKGRGMSLSWSRTNSICTAGIRGSIQDVDDYIERIKTAGGVYTYRNIQDVRVYDISFSADGKWLSVAASFAKGYDRETGDDIDDIPPAKFTATFTPSAGRFEPFLNIQLADDKSHPGPSELERGSWAVVNIGCACRFTDAFKGTLKISNAGDQFYWASADESAVPSEGRNVTLSFRYDWNEK